MTLIEVSGRVDRAGKSRSPRCCWDGCPWIRATLECPPPRPGSPGGRGASPRVRCKAVRTCEADGLVPLSSSGRSQGASTLRPNSEPQPQPPALVPQPCLHCACCRGRRLENGRQIQPQAEEAVTIPGSERKPLGKLGQQLSVHPDHLPGRHPPKASLPSVTPLGSPLHAPPNTAPKP